MAINRFEPSQWIFDFHIGKRARTRACMCGPSNFRQPECVLHVFHNIFSFSVFLGSRNMVYVCFFWILFFLLHFSWFFFIKFAPKNHSLSSIGRLSSISTSSKLELATPCCTHLLHSTLCGPNTTKYRYTHAVAVNNVRITFNENSQID